MKHPTREFLEAVNALWRFNDNKPGPLTYAQSQEVLDRYQSGETYELTPRGQHVASRIADSYRRRAVDADEGVLSNTDPYSPWRDDDPTEVTIEGAGSE